MPEAFTTYLENLSTLSTAELDRSAVELVGAEKQHVARVIAHIAEIARRKGDLEQGYPNLFEYCVRRLGLSEGSVALRIQVANVCRRFPQVLSALASGAIRLSVAGRLAPYLTAATVEKLLQDAAGMTRREVEEYLVSLSPRPVLEPAIRRRPSRREDVAGMEPAAPGDSRPRAPAPPASFPFLASAPPAASPAPSLRPSRVEPARSDVYNFRFAAGKDFREKLLRLAEVLGVEQAERNMGEVLERALDLALERKDPRRKHERRLARAKPPMAPAPGSAPVATPAAPAAMTAPETPAASRHVPSPVRGRVLGRAGHRCEFTGPDGTRCTSRTGLEIEHTRAYALFHSHEERFLQALCPAHNRLRAERVFGGEFIRRKVEERRRRRTSVVVNRECEVAARPGSTSASGS